MAVTHLMRDDFRTKIYDFERNPGSWKFEGDKPALVDFYASWCGPCKMLAPIIEELGEEYAGRVDIYKVDVDEQQELAALFGVRSIPTLLFIPRDGKPQLAQGAMPRAELRRLIDQLLLGGK
ncbi:thioredoxin [uncultured Alistipes sp.]|uniref:thioredoxin n=1 Tax=uncultured Alistipes sp. TaxID=538949 RepID=UPI002805B44E|nr:thioredoxin [uncultured Alistipes sp.]